MFSIRMRASRKVKSQKSKIKKTLNSQLSTLNSEHISGAEGIYEKSEIQKICEKYIKRALTHSRGKPDEIIITIEKIRQKPKTISLLPVITLDCNSPEKARKIITQKLESLGISKKAIDNGFVVLNSKKTMRGASLLLLKSGARVEPDKERGVRVSRMGIGKAIEKKLSKILSNIVIPAKAGIQTPSDRKNGTDGFRVKPGMTNSRFTRMKINTTTVKEALVLASKAASWPDVIAEACISDDPDYTTGYIASKEFGYLRIPNIKREKKMHGGRVFFIRETADIAGLTAYLEKKPVIII
ncbi:MAG: 6-carboxyhexanoate--CoA ligase [Thermodesulfovibrionales bacterium]|nr:6-carboxyhexanoate--CoA ligase [Thermodesulfovibrionales bacterium]